MLWSELLVIFFLTPGYRRRYSCERNNGSYAGRPSIWCTVFILWTWWASFALLFSFYKAIACVAGGPCCVLAAKSSDAARGLVRSQAALLLTYVLFCLQMNKLEAQPPRISPPQIPAASYAGWGRCSNLIVCALDFEVRPSLRAGWGPCAVILGGCHLYLYSHSTFLRETGEEMGMVKLYE